MLRAPDLMDLKLSAVLVVYLKLYDITSVVLIIFYIPAGSNLSCVLFVKYRIKNRLVR